MDARSTLAFLPPRDATPLLFASLGLGAILVRAAGAALASYAETRLAADVGSRLRSEVLEGLLSGRATLLRASDPAVAEIGRASCRERVCQYV